MIETVVGQIGGQEVVFHQAQTREEAQELGLPKGLYFFWTVDGERVYTPKTIVDKVQASVRDGSFDVTKLLTKTSIQNHYQALSQAQSDLVLQRLREVRKQRQEQGLPEDALKQIDELITAYETGDAVSPMAEDGVSRPGPEHVGQWFGETALKEYERILGGGKN